MTASTKAIPTDRLVLLYCVMLASAAGNTAMQSVLPAIASQLKMPDFWLSLAYSWSALLWVITAPRWAQMSDKRGRKALIKLGSVGFIASMGLSALAIWLGTHGILGPLATFIGLGVFRTLYGGLGSAAPPAVQAYIASRTERSERTKALSMLASSFGIGTVLGPSLAAFLVFEPFGLAGPMFFFAAFGLLVLVALHIRLPNDEPRFPARGDVPGYPNASAVSGPAADARPETEVAAIMPLTWRDARIYPWLVVGVFGGHAHSFMLGVIGFLVRDRLGLQGKAVEAVQAIGSVMLMGALATLVAQWGLIPILNLKPRSLVLWGSLAATISTVMVASAGNHYTLSMGYALFSLGMGLFRSGFTAGASLAVGRSQQGDIAGKISAVNGSAYIIGPATAVASYGLWWASPFLLIAISLVFLLFWGRNRLVANS